MTESVNLVKKVRGINTYTKVIDNSFSEFITAAPVSAPVDISIEQFFGYYDELFYDIPVTGEEYSHAVLVNRSQQYIGGSIIDAEKQALIDEINSLRQQIIDLSQTYLTISNITE